MNDAPPQDEASSIPVAAYATPLEYAGLSETRDLSATLKTLSVLALASVAVTPVLILAISTELIICTGAAEVMLAACMCAFGNAQRGRLIVRLGVAHILFAASIALWIFLSGVDPSGARWPALIVACVGTVAGAYPTWLIFSGQRR